MPCTPPLFPPYLRRELAVVHARENIRFNSICPGPLRTPLLMDFLNTEEKKQRRLVHVPMGRFGTGSRAEVPRTHYTTRLSHPGWLSVARDANQARRARLRTPPSSSPRTSRPT